MRGSKLASSVLLIKVNDVFLINVNVVFDLICGEFKRSEKLEGNQSENLHQRHC